LVLCTKKNLATLIRDILYVFFGIFPSTHRPNLT
jgi:hypothetical protein